jgi:UDP-2,3-diacylglucosamine pyrophosphatase LpxH
VDPVLKSYFFSDLHLFAKRSTASADSSLIREVARESHTIVLGGDIIDFKWSIYPSLDDSIDAATRWLVELLDSNPYCVFHYILGNHDGHPRFVAELELLAKRYSQLHWHPYTLRIKDCVFLHGDIVDCQPCNIRLAEKRKRQSREPLPPNYAHWLYELAVFARLHRLAMHVAIRQKSVLTKLSKYLAAEGLGAEDGVKYVYFGHTHRQVDGISFAGLVFYNGGASIKGLSFRVLETLLPHLT